MSENPDTLLDRFGRFLAGRLQQESSGYEPYTPSDPETLRRTLQPGDVLLVEGNQRISSAIKYLTQSTWSHSALYVGDALPEAGEGEDRPRLVEVNLGEGCVAVPLSKYASYNTRICRASGLSPELPDSPAATSMVSMMRTRSTRLRAFHSGCDAVSTCGWWPPLGRRWTWAVSMPRSTIACSRHSGRVSGSSRQ